MLENLISCQRCALHLGQAPLLDKPKQGAVMVVGLSAKRIRTASEIPLDNHTKSGHLILSMEEIAAQYGLEIYRSNLVKCPPLDKDLKLRYPTQVEIRCCFKNMICEIDALQPRIAVLLGKLVQSAFEEELNLEFGSVKDCQFPFQKKLGRYYVASYHPSYVMRSTFRKEQYLQNFSGLLRTCLE